MSPSSEHEVLHRVFQYDEVLFARSLANILGKPVPAPVAVSVLNVDLTETRPLERRADTVLLAKYRENGVLKKYILLIESQTDEKKERRRRWPYYIAYLQDKYDCPVVLLVVCSKKETAEWAREPIVVGLPGLVSMTVTPVVLGPDNVPAVTTVDEASGDIIAAVFSALTHSRGSRARDILVVLSAALDTIDPETAGFLAEYIEDGLGETPAQSIWKVLMATVAYPYVSSIRSQGREEGRQEGRQEGRAEGRQEGREEGRAQGEAAAVLRVLAKREIAVDDKSRERIESCTDLDLLGTWLDRSLTAEQVDELFA
jgi:hypothetical protein